MTVPYPSTRCQTDVLCRRRRGETLLMRLNLAAVADAPNLRPSPRCDDEAFIRRATLDYDRPASHLRSNVESFLADPAKSNAVTICIETLLLASEDFRRLLDLPLVRHVVDQWNTFASGCRQNLLPMGSQLRCARRQAVGQTGSRESLLRPAASDRKRSDELLRTSSKSPEDMTENACQAFLGLSIGCAKCHNHPLEKWTNDQYYAMANMFARVRAKGWGGDGRNGDGHSNAVCREFQR